MIIIMERYFDKKEMKKIIKLYYKEEEKLDVKVKLVARYDQELSDFFGKFIASPCVLVKTNNKYQEINNDRVKYIVGKVLNGWDYKVNDVTFNTSVSEYLGIPKFTGMTVSFNLNLDNNNNKVLSRNNKPSK